MQKAEVITTVLVTGGLVGLFAYLARLARMQKELEVIPTGSIYSLDFKALTIRLDLTLKNPTAGSLKIKVPFVKLYYKSSLIGSSQVVDKEIVIPAYGQAVVNKILIELSLTTLLITAADMIRAIQKKEPVKIDVKAITAAIIGEIQSPIEKSQTITLKS